MEDVLDSVEISDLNSVSVILDETVSSFNIHDALQFLLHELDVTQDYSQISDLMKDATVGLTIKCVSRVAKLLNRLDKIEEQVFDVNNISDDLSQDQENLSRQVNSILDISRKFISLVHELDIISDQSPKRRYLLDLLEKLSDNEIEKLISLIEQEVLSDKGGKDV